MAIKIELNDSPSEKLQDVAKRHIEAGAGETLDEAFSRILSTKNLSDTDKNRIKKVKNGLEQGTLKREDKAYKKDGSLKRLGKAEVMRLYELVLAEERRQTLVEMKENMPDNFIKVDTDETLYKMVDKLMENTTVPLDVESTGTDVWKDYIVGYVLTDVKQDEHYYIPTKHDSDEVQLEHDKVTDAIRPVLERSNTLYIGHNIKFDIKMLKNENINVTGRLWDTQEVMRILNENEDSYALKVLATKYLGMPSKTYGELFGNSGFDSVSDLMVATAYAAKDGDITMRLYEFQKEHLETRFPEMYQYVVDIEMPLIHAVMDMEDTGFVIDVDFAESYGEELSEGIETSRKRIEKVLGDVNLNSPVQLKPALEHITGRSLPDTNASATLKPLAKDFPVIEEIINYKELTKLYGTYVETIPKLVNEETGKLMANFKQNGAATGRFSSGGTGVNLQNQGDESRRLFIAPEGKVWVGADFKSQEVRNAASISGEEVLLQGFKDGDDPYSRLASTFYGKPIEEVYKDEHGVDTPERKAMKTVYLGTLYGMGSYSLGKDLGISKEEAEKLQDSVFGVLPSLNEWLENTKKFASRNGFVWMHGKQRKRRLPMAKEQRKEIPYGKYWNEEYKKQRMHNAEISRSLRQGANAIIQGSSAIQTKATLIKANETCKEREGWDIVNVVHDEIIWQVPDTVTMDDMEVIEEVMTTTYTFDGVDNQTDLEIGRRWSDMISIKEWFGSDE